MASIISYPAESRYQSAALENAKQVATERKRLINLYAFNSGAVEVFLLVGDSADAMSASAGYCIYPVNAGGFIAIGSEAGDRMTLGIYVEAFTDVACTVGAGDVMWYKVDYAYWV